MLVEIKGMQKILQLSKGEPDNFCRPAVDPILGSVAKAYGGRALGVMLKAGYDEYKGSRVIVEAGGHHGRRRRGEQRLLGHARCGWPWGDFAAPSCRWMTSRRTS
jgi:hypothetical protein